MDERRDEDGRIQHTRKDTQMFKVVISFAGEILDQWTESNVEDALWVRDFYVQSGFNATVTRA